MSSDSHDLDAAVTTWLDRQRGTDRSGTDERWLHVSDHAYYERFRRREEAIRDETPFYRDLAGRRRAALPCCAVMGDTNMGGARQIWHRHVAGYAHVAAVFGVSERDLRRAVAARRKQPQEETGE